MNFLAHLSFPYIILVIVSYLLGINITGEHIILLLIFSVLPDFDLVVHFIIKKTKGEKFSFNINHHKWLSHWPIFYAPFLILFIIHPSITTFVMMYGLYSHLLLDTFADGHGIMWLKPLSKKWFNYFAEKTRGKLGLKWLKAYTKTVFYKTERITAIIMMLHILAR